MNRFHRWYCASPTWNDMMRTRLLPDATADVDLGDEVLELGPGPGLTTLELATRTPRLTAVEIDPELVAQATARTAGTPGVRIVQGDATDLPFDDRRFSAVVCMTMLHHLPDAAAQDRLFAEAHRVLRPGGVFCGSDNLGRGLKFRLMHLADTRTVVDPATLPARLSAAGFDTTVVKVGSRLVFQARVDR